MANNSQIWLQDHENTDKLIQKIAYSFSERNRYPKSSTSHGKITGSIRTSLTKLSNDINKLERNLDDASMNGSITYLEKNRRLNMLNQLKISEKQFIQMLQDNSSNQKDALLYEGTSSNLIKLSDEETDHTINMGTDQLLLQHDRIILEQDRGLETLSHIVQNQKKIAVTIGNEVDKQNELLDDMGEKTVLLQTRIEKETKGIRLVSRKSATCGLWMLVVFLLIAIIVIAAIPKP